MGDPLKLRSLTNAQVLALSLFLITTTIAVVSTGLGVYNGLKSELQALRNELINVKLLEQRVVTLERLCKISEVREPIQVPIEQNPSTKIIKYSEAVFPEHSELSKKLPKKLYYGDTEKT